MLDKNLNINESFICKIWEGGANYYSDIKTGDDEKITILNYGKRNFDEGPDYNNAKIKIGNKILLGDVEIHRDYSNWITHKHKGDNKYNSVILQVIFWDEGNRIDPKVKGNRKIPSVILSKYLNKSIREIWREIIENPSVNYVLPCKEYNNFISSEIIKSFLNKLSIERLNLKSNRIKERITELGHEESGETKITSFFQKRIYWEQAFYEFLFEALGFSKNKEPMLQLSKNLHINTIKNVLKKTNSDEIIIIQSLLYGCGGFLDGLKSKSGYPFALKKVWNSCDRSLKLIQKKDTWKFYHLRPVNFPTVRIAYGSQLISKILVDNLFKNIINIFNSNDFLVKNAIHSLRLFLEPSEDTYWNIHYIFGRETSTKRKLIGNERINDIITNVIIPICYLYSKIFNQEKIKANVLDFYTKFKTAGKNAILKIMEDQLFKDKGIKIKTAAIEQSVIQLFNFYCSRGKCDQCKIGMSFVKEKGYDYRIIFY